MIVNCPHCSKNLKVPDTAAGKRIRCPGCSGVVQVAAAESSASAPAKPVAPSSSGSAGASQASAPVVRKARAVSGDSAATPAEPAPAARPSKSSATSASSSRGESTPARPARDAQRPASRSTASRSTASRPKKRPPQEEETYDDDYGSGYDTGYDSWGGAAEDDDSANPFAPPKARSSGNSRASSKSDDASARRTAGLGLLIQGWATVSIFALMLFIFGIAFVAGFTAVVRVPAGPQGGMMILVGLSGLGVFVAAIVMLIGEGMCLTIPARSGAKGLIIGAIACLVLNIGISIIQAVSDTGNGFGPQPFTRASVAGDAALAILGLLCNLGHMICFELFLRKASLYVGRTDLASQATRILIGIPGCFVVMILCGLISGLLADAVSPILGLIMLIPILGAGIAIIVLAVMHVVLLFRVGSALRS